MTALGDGRENDYDGAGRGEDEIWDDAETEALDLDEDEPLPWLESSDYEEEETVDTARVIGFISLALVLLALLIGGFWFLTNRGTETELAGDGSTIAAPEGPIKERPADPGGKQFAGTGDVAPAVGEGQTRAGRLADDGARAEAPRPSIAAPVPGEPAAKGAAFVQVGALSSKAGAEARWAELLRRTETLSGFKYRVEEAQIDNGTVFRLQAVVGDRAAAERLCNALKADGIECIVK